MQKIKDILKGKKTYLAAVAMVLTAVAAWSGGDIEGQVLVQRLIEAVGLVGLRAGVEKAKP